MTYASYDFLIWAVALGGLSAVSLPLGSVVGLQATPKPLGISVLAAFGAGALIAALSVELVAPTVFALDPRDTIPAHGDPHSSFIALILGATIGGVLFVLLDFFVNRFGGFLRNTSSTISYFKANKHARRMQLLEQLSSFPLLQELPADHINALVDMVRPVHFKAGNNFVKFGDSANELIFVVNGTVDVLLENGLRARLGAGEVIGVITLLMNIPYVASMTAAEEVDGLTLTKRDVECLRSLSREFDKALQDLSSQRLETIENMIAQHKEESIEWLREAGHALRTGAQLPSPLQLQQAKEEYKGAPLAIWLGILLDGIPESFVIGAGLVVLLQNNSHSLSLLTFADVVPYTLIAGLFLSNFPEALASSANMRMAGWSKGKIFLLWFSLMIITAVGAGMGFVLAMTLNHTWLVFAEGLAAGAMLTMIAAAMIPEAVHMGRANLVGLSTLAGFIAAIVFKLLE